MEIFSEGWNFNSLNYDDISSRMISETYVKIKLQSLTKI